MKEVYLGVGTNLGNREHNLKIAMNRVGEYIGRVLKYSSVYETEPWGFKTKNQFLNMVLKVETELTPSSLLSEILYIESLMGRVRGENHYISRIIDIDILFYDDLIIKEPSLEIPHPLLQERKFVLAPLCEVGSEIIHPVLNKSIALLLKSCEDKSKVYKR